MFRCLNYTIFILTINILNCQLSFCQSALSIDNKQFYAPGTGNYLEFYCSIDPTLFTIDRVKDSGLYCKIGELIIVRQGEKIIDFRKKIIRSAYFTDSTAFPFTISERFVLEPGKYVIEFESNDVLSNAAKPLKTELLIEIKNRSNKTVFSQIETVEKISSTITHPSLAKSGYEIHPFVSTFYPDYYEKLAYYSELYFSEKDVSNNERFVLTQYLTNFETGDKIEGYAKLSKINATAVYPVINTMDIKNLPTGNYNLVLELRDKQNNIVCSEQVFIERFNVAAALSAESINSTSISGTFVEGFNNLDSLNLFVSCIRPIATNGESDMIITQLTTGSVISKKQFFYLFWKNRDNENPEKAWLTYKTEVKKADHLFATKIKRSWDTDRGRIFLKYGPPNQITDRANEPSAWPYQIWQYYHLGKFNNKYFLFYSPSIVTNDYEVLNSNVPGEFKNPRWEATLYSRNTTNPNIDFPNQNNKNQYGGNVEELIRNPR